MLIKFYTLVVKASNIGRNIFFTISLVMDESQKLFGALSIFLFLFWKAETLGVLFWLYFVSSLLSRNNYGTSLLFNFADFFTVILMYMMIM